MSGGFTLGYLLIGVAIVDVIAVLMMARGLRDKPDATDEQRRGIRTIVIAAFVLAVALCLFALFHPVAQIRII